jgi:hypothetical protein
MKAQYLSVWAFLYDIPPDLDLAAFLRQRPVFKRVGDHFMCDHDDRQDLRLIERHRASQTRAVIPKRMPAQISEGVFVVF